jgi:hypothetical protein
MNPLPTKLAKGSLGEIFVQLRLLQYDVQAAPPIKDSGNDLIAIKKDIIKAIQVKTTTKEHFKLNKNALPPRYHLLALVKLVGENREVDWSKSKIYLLPKDKVTKGYYTEDELKAYCLSSNYLDDIFSRHKTNKTLQSL